ncbi:CRAL/TRIO domain-containing protein [Ditylenchus destructor]|uniref:CRAL/TRIO domain-containing protein n=1 Tax=Ditylenchus destructor TaxID=166010 RepID=A0AAD4R7A8_9BILA|nr:CRAL/TRIO domain-containing protein [Ditylenchus destructor]
MQDQRARPDPFTEEQLQGAKALRTRLGHILPPTFNTDFFLARWYRAYKGNLDAVEKNLRDLISHREALDYGPGNVLKCCSSYEFAQKTFERFAISKLEMDVFSGDVAVFLQRMRGVDLKEIMKAIPLSYVLHSYMLLQECFHNAMFEQEQRSGKPSAVVVIIDLAGLCISDFINPLSVPSRLARLVVKMWSDYFSENLIRLYLLHPPALLSIMWQIARHIVDAKTQSRIVFVTKLEEIHNYLEEKAIPRDYGGQWVDSSGFSSPPESCVSQPKPVLPSDYFNAKEHFWKKYGVSTEPELKSISLKSKATHEVTLQCRAGQKLLWLFTVNSDITFEIVHFAEGKENDANETTVVWPKITLTYLKTPEHGFIECKNTGEYRVKFTNVSFSWLSAKLQYSILAQ